MTLRTGYRHPLACCSATITSRISRRLLGGGSGRRVAFISFFVTSPRSVHGGANTFGRWPVWRE